MPCELSGGIIAMATITKRGDSYRIKVSCGYDVNGKQVVQTKTWKPPENLTERQIKKELDRQAVMFEEECKRGQITAAIKFETFAEQWFDEYAILNLRKSTYTLLKSLTKRVYPAIGHLRLDKITTRDVQKFVNDLLINGRGKQNGKPLARKTVLLHLSFISNIFRYAIKMSMLVDNPCSRVTVAKQEKKEKQIYTIDEMKQLFRCLENAPLKYRVFVTLAVYSGYRRGEMLGLEWKDIDWENGVINVRRTSNYTKLHGMFTDTTKTKKSQRSTKYPAVVINLLRELKDEQDKQREILGDKWVESDRLFVADDGAPLFVNNPYKWLQKFCKDNGLRFCDIHSYRHFHASALIFAGVDPVTVSADLGHSAVSTTTSVYCHLFQEAQARTSSVISKVLDFGTNGQSKMKPSA